MRAEIARLADTTHLEFKGLKDWRYEIQKSSSQKFTLNVPPLDDASAERLQKFSDPLIRSIEVDRNGPDGSFILTLQTTATDIEAFDYLTDDPSRLIVDFYRKPESEGKISEPSVTRAKKGQAEKAGRGNAGRKPAGDEFLSVPKTEAVTVQEGIRSGVFDGADENYDRFKVKDYEIRDEAILASKYNIYLPFPMLKMPFSPFDQLIKDKPEFVIKPKDTKENKEARLLLTLFERKRFAVFIKAYDYFVNKYPDSEYLEIVKNLCAHVYLARWRESQKLQDFQRTKQLLYELVHRDKESPLREYNYLLMAFMEMERGDALATVQTFQAFLKDYPNSTQVPQIRKGLAEALVKLAKFDEATSEYEILAKDFSKTAEAQESVYRMGDVAFSKGDYSAAIRLYENAIRKFPQYEKSYPNLNFNMAEARFWQKDFKKSLDNYVRFVNLFPAHEHGGYALTRIGELLGILGADPRRMMGALLESHFRFGGSPGAKVARIRMLSQQMRNMKPKELKKALEEISELEKTVALKGISEFNTLMVAEGLTQRGDFQDALAQLVTYYQKNPLSVNHDIFRSRIHRNIANQMKSHVENQEFMKTLDFYAKYASTWLKNNDRIDVQAFLGQAFEQAGVYPEAKKIYSDALAHRLRIVGSRDEKERKVQEHLPSSSSLRLRIAASLAQDRQYAESFKILKEIGAGADLTPAETVERVQLNALIAEQRNDSERARQALRTLANQWQGDPALVAPVNLQLAKMHMKLNQPKEAEIYADLALAAEKDGETAVDAKVIAGAMSVRGDALAAQRKPIAAAETYQRLLERFEASVPLANVRYRLGQILYERGDLKGAENVWSRLEGSPQEFLLKIGKEKLADTRWRDEYNKYMNRIPAMSAQEAKK